MFLAKTSPRWRQRRQRLNQRYCCDSLLNGLSSRSAARVRVDLVLAVHYRRGFAMPSSRGGDHLLCLVLNRDPSRVASIYTVVYGRKGEVPRLSYRGFRPRRSPCR